MQLLCTGDVHLGRRPSRLPADLAARASAAAAWLAVVEAACERGVDAVVLTGDVVDRDNRFFEAFGPLEQGARRLFEAGIEIVAVAGNHDFDVLPRLAATLDDPRFHLVGRGGQWERVTLERDGVPVLHVDGWSFAREHVRHDPLSDYADPGPAELPTIGLLHTDVDQAGSPYAPTRLADLRARPVTAWLIGHVHKPRWVHEGGGAPVLNPGSPQPLDPGEPGRHGAWLVQIDGAGACTAEMVPVARARYDPLAVDLSDATDRAAVERLVLDAVTAHLDRAAEDAGPLERVSLRLELTGRSAVHGQAVGWLADADELAVRRGTVQATVERVRDHTRPAVDLAQLARGNDPAGHLARLLLGLEQEPPPAEVAALLDRARRDRAAVDRARAYVALQATEDEDDERQLRDALALQGHRLLDRLLQQRGGEP